MEKPLVSVIIPCYNCSGTIKETISSVQQQSYPNWEVVCVDDGSNDDTVMILAELSSLDKRISFYERERMPKGGSTCRNIGAEKSHGEYLIFLDGDDLLATTCIEERIKAIDGTDNRFIVRRMAHFTNNISEAEALEYYNLSKKAILYYYASGTALWQVTSPIWRRSFFEELHGFNESFKRYQDVELNFRAIMASQGKYVFLYNEPADCYYRKQFGIDSEVFIRKKMASFESAGDIINLVYTNRGCFEQNKLSLSIMMFISNLYYNINVTPLYKQRNMKFKEMSAGRLESMLKAKERFVLFLLQYVFVNHKLNFNFSRVIRRVYRNNILKIK